MVMITIFGLATLYYSLEIEGYTNNTNAYVASAKQKAIDNDFASGYAGSGSDISGISDTDIKSMNYLNAPTEASFNQLSTFKQNDPNVQYHLSAEDIKAANYDQGGDLSFGYTWVVDSCGNKVAIPYTTIQGDITYHRPGAYLFGASTYVPTYEDSVYLSSTTSKTYLDPTNSALYRNPSLRAVGACEEYKNNPLMLEQSCQAMNPDTCASTTCCVLLGGSKCVAGNKHGPYRQENYGDAYVRNKDFYYYQGKCYGNCSQPFDVTK